jgi:hypothetical protein
MYSTEWWSCFRFAVVGTQNAEIGGGDLQRYGMKLVQLLKYRPKIAKYDKLGENN